MRIVKGFKDEVDSFFWFALIGRIIYFAKNIYGIKCIDVKVDNDKNNLRLK